MAANLEDVRKALAGARAELLAKKNVIAVGVGYKTVEGKQTEDLSIVCSVEAKKSSESLSANDVVPKEIAHLPTDVNSTGHIHAFQDPKQRFRPSPAGVSLGHFAITAGTLGIYVKKNGKTHILSNNHVIANSNDASLGDAILQPGPTDGGSRANDQIARLTEFVPIVFEDIPGDGSPCPIANAAASTLNAFAEIVGSDTRLRAVKAGAATDVQRQENQVDAAIAEVLNESDVQNEILNIGTITETGTATLGMGLKKMGRTTDFTTGTVQQIDVSARVSYGANKNALFVNQFMAGAMSAGGDSGSAVISDDNKLVGLLFAGSQTTTIMNPISAVFSSLQITL